MIADTFALSYVWGGVEQERFQLGSEPKSIRLPQTIEDAITLTVRLQKQYLWVDSICIDQGNNADKIDQIGRMGVFSVARISPL
jgi:hypothetical protein